MPVSNKPDSWRSALKFINRCPICSTAYSGKEAKLFAKNETTTLVHLTCGGCASYFVAMVLFVGQGVSSVGMVTDLSYEDVRRLYQADPISTDEIIDAHELLQNKFFINSLVFK